MKAKWGVVLGLLLCSSTLWAHGYGYERHRPHYRHEHFYTPAPVWHGHYEPVHSHQTLLWRSGNWHYGPHEGRLGWWWIVAGMWYFYSQPVYPYPEPYPMAAPVQAAPVYVPSPVVQQAPPVAPVYTEPSPPPPVAVAPQQFWYYCRPAQAYYPYVPQCGEPWLKVPAPSAR